MKFIENTLEDGVTSVFYVKLSLDEEYNVARWWMDSMCLRWIDTKPDFKKFLFRVFEHKSRGKDFTAYQLDTLGDFIIRYQDLLSPFPKLKEGTQINVPKNLDTKEGHIDYYQRHIRTAWYEIWDIHPSMRKHAMIKVFPGTNPDDHFIEEQEKLESDFWQEVSNKQAEWNCSRQEAITGVSDYMQRADMAYRIDSSDN